MKTMVSGGDAPRPRRGEVRVAVLHALSRHPGALVDLETLTSETGFTARQVAGAIHAARVTNDVLKTNIEVIVRGRTWRWRDASPVVTSRPPATSTPLAPSKHASSGELDVGDVGDRPAARESRRRGRGRARLYEQVGKETPDGDVILRDESNVVWRARRLT